MQERQDKNQGLKDEPQQIKINQQPMATVGGLRKGHILSAEEKELKGIKDLQRGKSFLEARQAVQKQIERIFSDTQNPKKEIKHAAHGVSHAIPTNEGDEDIPPPPPVHYGVNQAIKNGLNNRKEEISKWQSAETLSNRASSQNSSNSEHDRSRNASDLPMNKFKSMENITKGLPRSDAALVDINLEDREMVSARMRKFKMENGKSLPNIAMQQQQIDGRMNALSSNYSDYTNLFFVMISFKQKGVG